MKILMLIDTLEIGGAETHLCSLCEHLKAKGIDIAVASAGGRLVKRIARVGINHLSLPSYDLTFKRNSHKSTISHSSIFKSLCRLFSIIKAERPDIVHAHTRKTAFIADLICHPLGIPLVTTAHAHFSMIGYRALSSRWGDGTIAVSEDIAEHITCHSLAKPKKIRVIRNGVQ